MLLLTPIQKQVQFNIAYQYPQSLEYVSQPPSHTLSSCLQGQFKTEKVYVVRNEHFPDTSKYPNRSAA
jgi:hypothetical protein